MKATQVGKESFLSEFDCKPHWKEKDSICHYCNSEIRPTYGVKIGNNTYCHHMCYSNHKRSNRGEDTP